MRVTNPRTMVPTPPTTAPTTAVPDVGQLRQEYIAHNATAADVAVANLRGLLEAGPGPDDPEAEALALDELARLAHRLKSLTAAAEAAYTDVAAEYLTRLVGDVEAPTIITADGEILRPVRRVTMRDSIPDIDGFRQALIEAKVAAEVREPLFIESVAVKPGDVEKAIKAGTIPAEVVAPFVVTTPTKAFIGWEKVKDLDVDEPSMATEPTDD